MNNKAVVTITIGKFHEMMATFSHPSILKYAEKLSAEFIVINNKDTELPHWRKFEYILPEEILRQQNLVLRVIKLD